MRADVRLIAAAASFLALALAAAGCGSAQKPIKIGFFFDCKGGFSTSYEAALAGAELPFIERGAKLVGATPSSGVSSISVGGRRVELELGCDFYASFTTTLAEARRLVEQKGATILVAPNTEPIDLVIRQYARRMPSVAFIATGYDPRTTLDHAAPNLFRFSFDARQAQAGAGAYAYNTLGWRRAVIFGEADPFGWSIAAGFVAEFCSLGGRIVERAYAPFDIADWSRLVRRIPRAVDGVALMAGIQTTRSFFSAYRKVRPDLARHVVMSGVPIALGERSLPTGVVAATYIPYGASSPAWTRYVRALAKAFPGYGGVAASGISVNSYDGVEAALEALQHEYGHASEQTSQPAREHLHSTATRAQRSDPT